MQIDQKTMLYTDILPVERKEMIEVARSIVLDGKVPHPIPLWVTDWLKAFDLDTPDRRLLVLSTAFPQRLLLSLVLESEKDSK